MAYKKLSPLIDEKFKGEEKCHEKEFKMCSKYNFPKSRQFFNLKLKLKKSY